VEEGSVLSSAMLRTCSLYLQTPIAFSEGLVMMRLRLPSVYGFYKLFLVCALIYQALIDI